MDPPAVLAGILAKELRDFWHIIDMIYKMPQGMLLLNMKQQLQEEFLLLMHFEMDWVQIISRVFEVS